MRLAFFTLPLFILSFFRVSAQEKDQFANADLKDSVVVNKTLQATTEKFAIDPTQALNLAIQARDLARKIGYKKGEATAIKYIGNANYILKNPAEALSNWEEALSIFEEIKDNYGVADLQGNIGTFYYTRGDNVKALEHYLQSLTISEKINYKKAMVTALNNIGGIWFGNESSYDKALTYYLRALPLCEELGDKNKLGAISVNVGNIYAKKNDDKQSLFYFNKALKAYEESPANIGPVYTNLGALYLKQGNYREAMTNYQQGLNYSRKSENQLDILKSLVGLGKVEMKLDNYPLAISYYRQAETIAKELDAFADSEDIYEDLANSYQKVNDFPNAYKYQKLFTSLKDSLYNADLDKKVTEMRADYEINKAETQVALKEADLKRQKLAKNAFMAGLLLILAIAFIIFRNYREKVRVNRIIEGQKNEIEGLLLNILPAEVANELQATGKATPRNYERVSVLFTDFKGFTTIADKMAPEDLVKELNNCFMAFDNIIESHDLEKIKTIGDSYMCAGGIPTPDDDHPFRIVRAAMEIQKYISENNDRRMANGQVPWDIRIGVHVGPLVAGVVGKKKYAYDIWGSTVNIASRMESSGVPGRVNISAATYEIVKNKYACMYRGKINAKNVGDVDMYLIDHEIETQVKIIGEKPAVTTTTRIIPG
jgi:class 3 adenylate cyclase/tetratricopeptide (TPR) repeat protein